MNVIQTTEDLFNSAAQAWQEDVPQGSASEFSLANPPHIHQYLMYVAGFEMALEHIEQYTANRKIAMGYAPTDFLLRDVLEELRSLMTLPTRTRIEVFTTLKVLESEPQ